MILLDYHLYHLNDRIYKTLYFKNQFPVSTNYQVYGTIFFPGLFFYVHIESPNPKHPEGPTPQAPNPINRKPQPQKPNMKPQLQPKPP